jgi:hypothetical protein
MPVHRQVYLCPLHIDWLWYEAPEAACRRRGRHGECGTEPGQVLNWLPCARPRACTLPGCARADQAFAERRAVPATPATDDASSATLGSPG